MLLQHTIRLTPQLQLQEHRCAPITVCFYDNTRAVWSSAEVAMQNIKEVPSGLEECPSHVSAAAKWTSPYAKQASAWGFCQLGC